MKFITGCFMMISYLLNLAIIVLIAAMNYYLDDENIKLLTYDKKYGIRFKITYKLVEMMHDTRKTFWTVLIGFIIIVSLISLFYMMVTKVYNAFQRS